MKLPYSIRQGDVLLVEAIYRKGTPKDAQPISSYGEDVILAFGEVTGHAHRISANSKVDYFDYQAERYLNVICETSLTHEEHTAIPILPRDGGYQQAFQVEDYGQEIQRVKD